MRKKTGLLVAALLVVVLGPALLAPRTEYIGSDYLDTYGTLWFFWWTRRALEQGGNLLWTGHLFYPWGKDLYLHTGGNLLDAALAAPLLRLLGPVAGMNLWLALVLASNAWIGGRLAGAAGAGRPGRAVAAALALLHPYVLNEIDLGRPTQGLLLFLGLFMLSLLGKPTPWRGVWGGLCLGLAGLAYWYYGLLGALVGGLGLAWSLVRGRWSELPRYAVAAAVSLVVALPLALPMLSQLSDAAVPGLLTLDEPSWPLGRLRLQTVEGDPQGLFVLGLGGREGGITGVDGLVFHAGVRVLFGGHLVILALALAALRRARLRSGLLLLWAFVLTLVALGPAAAIGDGWVANLPFHLLVEHVDLLRRWWWPGRALSVVLLALAALAGVGLTTLPRRWQAGAGALLVAWLGVALVREDLAPLHHWSSEVSPGIACLAGAPRGAVVELPYAYDQKNLYYQTLHERPTLGGMLVTKDSFVPSEHRALRDENHFVASLLAVGDRQYRAELSFDPPEKQALLDLGYRYLVARKVAFRRGRPQKDGTTLWQDDWGRPERILRPLLGDPAWQDEELAIYTLDGSPFPCPPSTARRDDAAAEDP